MSSSRPWYLLADEFSWQGWRHEGASRILPPQTLHNLKPWRRAFVRPLMMSAELIKMRLRNQRWRHLLNKPATEQPRYLLIESAWQNFSKPAELLSRPIELARAFRSAGIPVVFWNKEDPPHFEKFLPVALNCDIILTTDKNCVDRYRNAGFRGLVDTMCFPAQPQIHYQYLAKDAEKKLFFAGTLRPRYKERVQGFENLILPALEFGLHIFSRTGKWPDPCQPHIVGSYPYLELIEKYSAYTIGLNISSVKNSPTMFPRRIVEMPMANIFVISDNCSALTALFPEIPQSASPKRTKELLTYYLRCERERTEIIEELRKKIMEDYTYQKQQARISDMAQSLRR